MVGFAKLVVQTVAVVGYCAPAVKPSRASSLTILGMTVESNPVYATSLLRKSKQWRFAIWGVVPVVPGASVNAKGSDIGTRRMPGVVSSFALGKFDVPGFWHGVSPFRLRRRSCTCDK